MLFKLCSRPVQRDCVVRVASPVVRNRRCRMPRQHGSRSTTGIAAGAGQARTEVGDHAFIAACRKLDLIQYRLRKSDGQDGASRQAAGSNHASAQADRAGRRPRRSDRSAGRAWQSAIRRILPRSTHVRPCASGLRRSPLAHLPRYRIPAPEPLERAGNLLRPACRRYRQNGT